MNKRFLSFLLALVLCAGMTSVPAHAAGNFSDVAASHWGYSYIEKAASLGLVEGVGHGLFAPDQTVHYTEFLTMVTRYFASDYIDYWSGKAKEGTPWWVPYAMTADVVGYLDGTVPGDSMTASEAEEQEWDESVFAAAVNRYEMALILFRVAVLEELVLPSNAQLAVMGSKIPDWDQIPEKYQTPVAYCYASGLLQGVDPAGTFRGTGTMNRAQAAAVLCRLADASGDALTAVTLNGTAYSVPDLRYYYYISQGMTAYYASIYQTYYGVNLGYDPELSAGAQWADEEHGVTWADAFREEAVERLLETEVLCSAAGKAGFGLSDSAKAEMQEVLASIDSQCAESGISRASYIVQVYGRGVTEEIFLRNYGRDLLAEEYAKYRQNSYSYTDSELEEYYTAHSSELSGYLNDGNTWKDVAFGAMSQADLDAWVGEQRSGIQVQLQDGMNYVGAKNAV